MRVGTIDGFRGSWGSGVAVLVIDGLAIPCDNAPTVRALRDILGPDVTTPGHCVDVDVLAGQQVAYEVAGGMLSALAPAD